MLSGDIHNPPAPECVHLLEHCKHSSFFPLRLSLPPSVFFCCALRNPRALSTALQTNSRRIRQAPWDMPRGGKEKREVRRRVGKKKKNEATSRVRGEVKCIRRNRKDDERAAGEGEAVETEREAGCERAHTLRCVCVCDVLVCDLLGGLACRANELISPRCTVRFISLAGK